MAWDRIDAARLYSPAAERNREPIRAVLVAILGDAIGPAAPPGRLLEIGSGTGQHAAQCADALAPLLWQPSDPDPAHRASIAAWTAASAAGGAVAPPLAIDVATPDWPLPPDGPPLRAVLSINMIHIAPWTAALGLIAGAARQLAPGGRLILYGPFARGGSHTADSNAAFDASLRHQNPAWGVRDLDVVTAAAAAAGFGAPAIHDMPADNLTVVFPRP